jgi:hypothetical protein
MPDTRPAALMVDSSRNEVPWTAVKTVFSNAAGNEEHRATADKKKSGDAEVLVGISLHHQQARPVSWQERHKKGIESPPIQGR